jgi:hypothetical protein
MTGQLPFREPARKASWRLDGFCHFYVQVCLIERVYEPIQGNLSPWSGVFDYLKYWHYPG